MKGEQPFPLILLSCVCHKKFPRPLNSAYCHQNEKKIKKKHDFPSNFRIT